MSAVISFSRYRLILPSVSILLILLFSVLTFVRGGFNFGIDFSPGFELQMRLADANSEQIESSLSELSGLQVQQIGADLFDLRLPLTGDAQEFSSNTLAQISETFPQASVESQQLVGPDVAKRLTNKTLWLLPFAVLLILLYTWLRFKLIFAVSAIVALIHDMLFMLALIGGLQLEFSSATVAALLTILGYSLNDTIVIFDRIRENRGLMVSKDLQHIVDSSLTQTLSRTLITSLTTLLALTPVVILTQGSIQNVAVQLMIGVAVGTYSSIFIAAMSALALQQRQRRKLVFQQSTNVHRSTAVESQVSSLPRTAPPPPPPVQQTAEEIEQARLKRLKKKQSKSKKKR